MVECSSGVVPVCFACLAPLVGVDAGKYEEHEVQDPNWRVRISHRLAASTKTQQGGECLPDKARKDDPSKFEPTELFEDVPQDWSATFFYVVMPELEQAQSGRESDGRNEGTPDKKVDDQGDEWHDIGLPLKHQENHNDVVEKCEDELGNPLA